MDDGNMTGRFPAIVKSYDPKKRTCRVEIPAINSGGDVLTEAEIEYPIGDKSRLGKWETEIEILPEDTVWVDFIGGDPRYPVITGWRNPQAGNSLDWRRWHHKNIEHVTDEIMSDLVGTDKRTKVGKNYDIEVKENCSKKVDKDDKVKIAKNADLDIGENYDVKVGKSLKVNAGKQMEQVASDGVLIRSKSKSIILKSATGTLVI